jgi:hypothetical protein
MHKKIYILLIVVSGILPICSYAQNCGFKPYALAGCKIGRCVNGKWEQVCGESASESNSNLDTINNAIANPKIADIAGAMEQNQKRKEAEAARNKRQFESESIVTESPAIKQTKISAFKEMRRNQKDYAEMYMLGLVSSLTSANSILLARKSQPLYCPPQGLALNLENYMSIYDRMYEKNKDKIESLNSTIEIGVSDILLFGLMENFPCK